MQCFTITGGYHQPRIQPWIDVDNDDIVLGELGRGRQETRVPVPPEAEIVQKTRLIAVGSRPGLAVVLRDMSGFRGDWALYGPYTDTEWQQLSARRLAHRENGDGLIQPGHTGLGPCAACAALPGPEGPHPVPDGLIRAYGFRAQGAAGRMGGGPEYLIITDQPIALTLVRHGRLYGSSARLVLTLQPQTGTLQLDDAWDRAQQLHQQPSQIWSPSIPHP